MANTKPGDSSSKEDAEKAEDPLKHQENKLKSKYPNLSNKPAASKLLQKRLAKGKVYFDSGDYNMSKNITHQKSSSKKIPTTPNRLEPTSSGDEEHKEDDQTIHKEEEEVEDDDITSLPDPSKQAIPTPELLFLRRASLHMPKNTSQGLIYLDDEQLGAGKRRATVQTRGQLPGLPGLGVDPKELFTDGSEVPNPAMLARRRATLHVTSKLAID